MFNLPVEEITYDRVRDFCLEQREEGLDLDYKADWPNDLARIMCGMANVQGGMILIGVEEEGDTRRPDCPPIGVPGTEDVLHQRAVQIALDAIYPPVFPDVKICPLANDPGRAVVVIRLSASRLLHATDRRRRVYVRVADQGRGYELADLAQLEWLYKERGKSIELREFIIDRALRRAERAKSLFPRRPDEQPPNLPTLTVYTVPVFPDQIQDTDPPRLLRFAQDWPRTTKYWVGTGEVILPAAPQWRTANQSVYSQNQRGRNLQYFELGGKGLVLLHQELRVFEQHNDGTAYYVSAPYMLITCSAFIDYAVRFYDHLSWLGPLLVDISIDGIGGFYLDHRFVGGDRWVSEHAYTLDRQAILFADEIRAQDLADEHERILNDTAGSMFWTFGFADSTESIREGYLARIRGQDNR
jgi:hypothetical protein